MLAVGHDTDVVVIGAGIIGLAVAAELSRSGCRTIVVERHDGIARETTSRNSEVVHAGIYYPPGTLKAELCRSGRTELYARCAARAIPFRKLGKLIVASTDGEVPALEKIHTRAAENGVALEWLDGSDVRRLEPQVAAVRGLLSRETGIVDAHAYAMSFLAEAEGEGALLALKTEVIALERAASGWTVVAESAGTDGVRDSHRLSCRAVVNAAGLGGERVAALAGIDVDAAGYRVHFCKGDYFALAPGAPVSVARLVYPVPDGAGLGIHATLDLGGRIRFGPDAEFVDRVDYAVDAAKADRFAAAVGRYLPGLEAASLSPDYAGIRPKLVGPGGGFADFVVSEESQRGLPGLVNCLGIESPGLTAATAIARRVSSLIS
jgi:L-2-hydroxyglutarate oxidase LhgO